MLIFWQSIITNYSSVLHSFRRHRFSMKHKSEGLQPMRTGFHKTAKHPQDVTAVSPQRGFSWLHVGEQHLNCELWTCVGTWWPLSANILFSAHWYKLWLSPFWSRQRYFNSYLMNFSKSVLSHLQVPDALRWPPSYWIYCLETFMALR